MPPPASMLDELRAQYESARASPHPQVEVDRVDYQTGLVDVALSNVDRFDRVTLEFHSQAIDDGMLDDLLKLILGRDTAFLHRAPLAGLHGQPRA